jgi:hypothetical protein
MVPFGGYVDSWRLRGGYVEALSQWSVVEESVDGLTPLALDPVRCPVDASFLTATGLLG